MAAPSTRISRASLADMSEPYRMTEAADGQLLATQAAK
jgi:hypothetical protein